MRSQRARSGGGRFVVYGVVAVLEVSVLAGLAGCVDGVTPDCSDAATQCGPNIDGSLDTNQTVPPVDSAVADAQGDADAPIDLDAGDEG